MYLFGIWCFIPKFKPDFSWKTSLHDSEQHTLVGAVGREPVCFLQGAKVDFLAGLALPVEANGLDLDDVVCLFLQVPKDTRTTGGVDLPNESLHVSILPLGTRKGSRSTENIEVSRTSSCDQY